MQDIYVTVALCFKVTDAELLQQKAREGWLDCNNCAIDFRDLADAAGIALLCGDLLACTTDYGLELIDAEDRMGSIGLKKR
jgi:hypothetical protein